MNKKYLVEVAAMDIVNHTAEDMDVGVVTRQKCNDHCFDYAMDRINSLLEELNRDGKPVDL